MTPFARVGLLAVLFVSVLSASPSSWAAEPGASDGRRGAAFARPGIGPSTAEPAGAPHVWPEGIEVLDPIGAFEEDYCFEEDQTDKPHGGLGTGANLCIGFVNTTNSPIRVVLPAGLIFVSFDTETQNGLLIQVETFEVPPGDQPFYVGLDLLCLNLGRSPGGFEDRYRTGPVVDDPGVEEFIDLVAGKTLAFDDLVVLQNALWNVTDFKGLTADDRRDLAALP